MRTKKAATEDTRPAGDPACEKEPTTPPPTAHPVWRRYRPLARPLEAYLVTSEMVDAAGELTIPTADGDLTAFEGDYVVSVRDASGHHTQIWNVEEFHDEYELAPSELEQLKFAKASIECPRCKGTYVVKDLSRTQTEAFCDEIGRLHAQCLGTDVQRTIPGM